VLIVYEWNAWWQFKLVRAIPEAFRLSAQPGENAEELLTRCPSTAVAFVFHLNSTFSGEFPHARQQLFDALVARGVVPINAAVHDISKRWVQAHCAACGLPDAAASRQGDPDERLFVKTNHNYGGLSERLLSPALLAELRIPRPSDVVTDPLGYRLVRRGDIPVGWWSDSGLAIERYIENRSNRIYRVGFSGKRFHVFRLVNTNVVKKVDTASESVDIFCSREQLARGAVAGVEPEVGAAAVRFIESAHLDVGSLDVTTDDAGRPYVLDANVTPDGTSNSLRQLIDTRRGLLELIAERSPHVSRSLRKLGRGVWPTAPMLRAEIKRLTIRRKLRTLLRPH
jgi:hypothetical protein